MALEKTNCGKKRGGRIEQLSYEKTLNKICINTFCVAYTSHTYIGIYMYVLYIYIYIYHMIVYAFLSWIPCLKDHAPQKFVANFLS